MSTTAPKEPGLPARRRARPGRRLFAVALTVLLVLAGSPEPHKT